MVSGKCDMIKREQYLAQIRPFYHSDMIKVLMGIRRCGKSVILMQIMDELLQEGIDESHILYMNFEDMEYYSIKTAEQLYEYVKERMTSEGMYFLFFDEIQMVSEFERVINSFRTTRGASIFITGSNSRLLSGELATVLSGRYISFVIRPFNFKEYCEINDLDKDDVREEQLLEYLEWGGMPQRFLMQNQQMLKVFLNDVYHSIVLKDIVQRTGAKEVDLLNRLIEYIVLNPGQTFSAASLAKFLESDNRKISTETLYNYLSYMENSFLITKARRYDIRGKKILTKQEKCYLTDLGLGRIRNTGFKIELGALLENVVYNELLCRGYEVYIGKTPKGEVDFLAIKDRERVYYQVAYLLYDESVVEREFRAFDSIRDNYKKVVLSLDRFDFSQDGICHENVIDWLLER